MEEDEEEEEEREEEEGEEEEGEEDTVKVAQKWLINGHYARSHR